MEAPGAPRARICCGASRARPCGVPDAGVGRVGAHAQSRRTLCTRHRRSSSPAAPHSTQALTLALVQPQRVPPPPPPAGAAAAPAAVPSLHPPVPARALTLPLLQPCWLPAGAAAEAVHAGPSGAGCRPLALLLARPRTLSLDAHAAPRAAPRVLDASQHTPTQHSGPLECAEAAGTGIAAGSGGGGGPRGASALACGSVPHSPGAVRAPGRAMVCGFNACARANLRQPAHPPPPRAHVVWVHGGTSRITCTQCPGQPPSPVCHCTCSSRSGSSSRGQQNSQAGGELSARGSKGEDSGGRG